MGLKKEIIKSNIIFTLSKIVSIIIGFFFSIILARLLQPYEFGLFSFCMVVAGLLTIFSDIGLNNTIVKYVSGCIGKKKYKKAALTIKVITKYRFLLTLAVGILALIFHNEIATFIFNKPEAGLIIILSSFVMIFQSLFSFFDALFFGLKDFKINSISKILENVLKFILVLFLVIVGLKSVGAILGIILTYVILIIILLIIIFKKHKFILDAIKPKYNILKEKIKIDRKSILSFTLWVFLGELVITLYMLTDQIMISILGTIEGVGFYRIGVTWIGALITLIPVNTYILYSYFSGAENREKLNIIFLNSLKYTSIFVFPLAFLLSIFSGPLILSLYGESFSQTGPTLLILAFISIPLAINSMILIYFSSIGRPDIGSKVVFVMLILNIILNYFFILSHGIVGAAMATLIASIAQFIVFLFILIFKNKLTLEYSIFWKPLLCSIVVWYVASLFVVNNIIELFLYGLVLIIIYIILMFTIGGIKKEDIDILKYFVLKFFKK